MPMSTENDRPSGTDVRTPPLNSPSIERADLRWYVDNSERARSWHRTLLLAAGMLEGALAGDDASYRSDWSAHRMGTKWVFEDLRIRSLVDDLIQSVPDTSNERLAALKATALEADELGDIIRSGDFDRYEDRAKVHPFSRLIARMADLVDAIRTDVEVALLAAVSPETKT